MSMLIGLVLAAVWLFYSTLLDISNDTVFIVFGILVGSGIAGLRD